MVVWVVGAAALLGVVLAGYVLREKRPPGVVAVLHGTVGAAGLLWLLAIAGKLGSVERGTVGFGREASWFLIAALLGGVTVALMGWRGRRPPAWLLVVHAAAGICGWVLLVAI